jgi:outer membrane protein TolC
MRTIFIKHRKTIGALLFSIVGVQVYAQPVLDGYVQEAFKNNIVLQQKNISLDKALYALKTAQGLYLPTVAFQSSYQTGEGGRSIDIPVGDLMNPVYATLNRLTASNKFPQINNTETYFLAHQFFDSKITASVPVYNQDLSFNKDIQQQQYKLQKTDIDTYKRELVKNIKIAYFNYLLANRSIEIYQSALSLANEAKRTNEKLLANGKGLPAYVLRSESDVQHITAQLHETEQQAGNARMYFNFLLNADVRRSIDTSFNAASLFNHIQESNNDSVSVIQREELKLLQQSIELNKTVLKMNERFWYPKLNAFLNTGSQAQDFKFNTNSLYYMAGLQLDVPIFSGKRNTYKIKQAQLDMQYSGASLNQTRQQLNLAANVAKNNLSSYLTNYYSSQKQLEAAAAYRRLMDKGYREGVNSFIETVDARNQFTSAELLVAISQFKVFIAVADLERETASYNIYQ